MSYYDVYQKRLNRYGNDYDSRIQGKREREFEDYLGKSVYRIDFDYATQTHPGILEPNKQDESKTIAYLLTRVNLQIPNGTILQLPNKDEEDVTWMVFWLEDMKASGYNRYTVLRMNKQISWTYEGSNYTSWGYFRGKGTSSLRDKNVGGNLSVYFQDENTSSIIMPKNEHIKKDVYFTLGLAPYTQAFIVTGFDIQSTEGVEFVTVDPVMIKDETPPPQPEEGDNPSDYYWFNGGVQ